MEEPLEKERKRPGIKNRNEPVWLVSWGTFNEISTHYIIHTGGGPRAQRPFSSCLIFYVTGSTWRGNTAITETLHKIAFVLRI